MFEVFSVEVQVLEITELNKVNELLLIRYSEYEWRLLT